MRPIRTSTWWVVSRILCATGALPGLALADYTTPGTGVSWSLDDLVVHSGGAVTGGAGSYSLNQSVVVARNDRLTIAPGSTIAALGSSGTIGVEIRGKLTAIGTASAPIVFVAQSAIPGAWRGLEFRDTNASSEFNLHHCEVAHAVTAVDVVGAPVAIEYSWFHDNLDKVIDFADADGVVRHCRLEDNRRRTITMTLSSSPLIEYCHLENNNIENSSPYPYINIGLQGINSPTVRGCTILGSGHQMSGGISIWAASNGVIEDNRIEGCGYGILCYQTGASPTIRKNWILDNNINPDTVNWGFGIACNGANAPIVAGNVIQGHGYGVAIINGGAPNLGNLGNGSTEDDGGNSITGNGLSGEIYALYNNTPLPQMAQGNWWGGGTAEEVEEAIFHQPDNPALGPVDYTSWKVTSDAPPANPVESMRVVAWPNPFRDELSVGFALATPGEAVLRVFDIAGRLVRETPRTSLPAGYESLSWDGRDGQGRRVPTGVYSVLVLRPGHHPAPEGASVRVLRVR